MSSISIIGLGGMARAIGTRAVEGGNTVEVIGRDEAKAKNLAAALGGGAIRQRRAGRRPVRGRAGRQGHHRHHQPRQR
jgi:3-hydroxyisobutyrate dehydrogenase-like beta-hydroxyacid dehydrogenase